MNKGRLDRFYNSIHTQYTRGYVDIMLYEITITNNYYVYNNAVPIKLLVILLTNKKASLLVVAYYYLLHSDSRIPQLSSFIWTTILFIGISLTNVQHHLHPLRRYTLSLFR